MPYLPFCPKGFVPLVIFVKTIVLSYAVAQPIPLLVLPVVYPVPYRIGGHVVQRQLRVTKNLGLRRSGWSPRDRLLVFLTFSYSPVVV